MIGSTTRSSGLAVLIALFALFGFTRSAEAVIDGVTGTSFNFTAKAGYITIPEGSQVLAWGYALDNGPMQYPGPTLIVEQGETIDITLNNLLDVPVSIVFPGQTGVTASGGADGLLTKEAAADGGSVTYSFTATHAGTYLYHSGTDPVVQVEMGLVGAIVVRPTGYDPQAPRAYGHADTAFDHEYLFLLTEMDTRIHDVVAFEGVAALANYDYLSDYFPNLWMINGRGAPDTMAPAGAPWLPNQPYNCLPRTRPAEKVLLRIVGAGRDLHPFHHHGNHALVIAENGRLLQTAPGMGPDLGWETFTIKSVPGRTTDALFTWTGHGLGWDIYGHKPGDPMEPGEDPHDHGKPFPTTLPSLKNLTFGGWYSGSPFLGQFGPLPPGEGGLNLNGGLFFMWHSHTEKELINFDVFPGGMLTMLIVEPPGVSIP